MTSAVVYQSVSKVCMFTMVFMLFIQGFSQYFSRKWMVGLKFGFLEGKQKRKEGMGQSSKRETYLEENYDHFDFASLLLSSIRSFQKIIWRMHFQSANQTVFHRICSIDIYIYISHIHNRALTLYWKLKDSQLEFFKKTITLQRNCLA